MKNLYKAQPRLDLAYRGQTLKQQYIPDFIVSDAVILELKAVAALGDEHQAQLLNYLHATGLEVGLLVNFGHYPQVEYRRMVL